MTLLYLMLTTAGDVGAIEVEGLRRVGKDAALSVLSLRPGSAYDESKVTEDLRALWGTGFFRDVQIYREAVGDEWRVVIHVTEKPSIREVRFEGYDGLSKDDIEGVVNVKPNSILSVDLLQANVEKVKALYVEKGYYLAKVDYQLLPLGGPSDQVDVVFKISEQAKVMVRQITFIGNDHVPDEDLRSIMQTQEGGDLSWITSKGTYSEEFFQTDLLRIQAYYHDRGYVMVQVSEPSARLSTDRKYIYLSLRIQEGEVFDIGEITFAGQVTLEQNGAFVVTEDTLRERVETARGDRFERTRLHQDVQRVTDAYRDYGYAYANVTPNTRIDKEKRIVDLELEVQQGDIITIERIEVTGNTRTRDKVIRRELQIAEGDLYSASLLRQSEARIYQLGFFETVNITPSRGSSAERMNLTIAIKEKTTGTFQVGAGFSSVESFIATAQIVQNNFLGNGQLMSFSAQFSLGEFARQLATLQFYDTYCFDTDWSCQMNAYLAQRYYRDFQRNASGISPSIGYPITKDLRIRGGWTLEKTEISTDLLGGGGTALHNLARDGWNSDITTSLMYDTRDNRLFPSSGHFHTLDLAWSSEALGSEEGLAYKRMQLILRYFYPLPWGFVLTLNTEFGYVFGGGTQGVPISERFFPGGIFSVRGFEPRGLGPVIRTLRAADPTSESTAFTIGGNKQAVFNLELQFPILEAAGIKGVVFLDAGNAFDDDEDFFYANTDRALQPDAYLLSSSAAIKPPLGLYYSFGFGFRWFSPMGPLRFEWGIPITKRDQSDRDMIFEFTIGNMF
jgi:outer membrane protein insertion porin family